MPHPFLHGLAISGVFPATSQVAPTHSLQYLAYVYYTVASMPYQLEALISYHILFCKVIIQYVTRVLQ